MEREKNITRKRNRERKQKNIIDRKRSWLAIFFDYNEQTNKRTNERKTGAEKKEGRNARLTSFSIGYYLLPFVSETKAKLKTYSVG